MAIRPSAYGSTSKSSCVLCVLHANQLYSSCILPASPHVYPMPQCSHVDIAWTVNVRQAGWRGAGCVRFASHQRRIDGCLIGKEEALLLKSHHRCFQFHTDWRQWTLQNQPNYGTDLHPNCLQNILKSFSFPKIRNRNTDTDCRRQVDVTEIRGKRAEQKNHDPMSRAQTHSLSLQWALVPSATD